MPSPKWRARTRRPIRRRSNMTETIVHLKPRDQWRPGMTLDRLRAEMGSAVQLPGVSNIWTMPIINRIDMLTTGHPIGGGRQGLRERSRRRSRAWRDRLPTWCGMFPVRQRLSGAGDERPVSEHRRRSGGGRTLRHRRRRHAASDRDRDRRIDADHDDRRTAALSGARAVCAAVSAPILRPWDASWCRRPAVRRCR